MSCIRISFPKKNPGKGAGMREPNARDGKAKWAKKHGYGK